jgi:hypothetical protein
MFFCFSFSFPFSLLLFSPCYDCGLREGIANANLLERLLDSRHYFFSAGRSVLIAFISCIGVVGISIPLDGTAWSVS